MPNYRYTGSADFLSFKASDFYRRGVLGQDAVTFYGKNDVKTLTTAAYNLLVASGYPLVLTGDAATPGAYVAPSGCVCQDSAYPPGAPPSSGGTFTLYPSAQAGQMYSYAYAPAGNYINARAGSASPAANQFVGPGNNFDVGQWYQGENPDPETGNPETWWYFLGFVDFDLSTVTGTPGAGTVLSLGLSGDSTSVECTVQARVHDWGSTLTVADFVPGASLSSKTLVATLASSGIGAVGSMKAMTESGTALRDAITAAAGGTLRLLLCSDRAVAGTAPTDAEYLSFHAYNHATLKPKLVVVTT